MPNTRHEGSEQKLPISPVSTTQLELKQGRDDLARSSVSDEDVASASPVVSGQVKWTVACQAFVMFIVSIDSTILTTTLPTVADALGANSNESFWIAASYLLASASCQPVMATMSDLCGRMAVSSAAVLLFTIGSVICSVASTVSQMLVGRTIQGIGGGGMTSLNLIILADLIPLRERSRYLGYIQLVFGLGTCLAPILGALLAERDWRWLFYINLPFCGLALIAVPICLRRNSRVLVTQITFATADWTGMAAFMTSITCFLVGLSWGGSSYPWRSFQTILPMALGCVGVFTTILYELNLARNPFLRKSLFKNRSAIISYCGTLQQGMMLFAASFFIPMYLMACKLYKPVDTGTAMLPLCLTLVPISGVVGALITLYDSYRWAVWAGWTLNTIGQSLLTTLDLDTPAPIWATIFVCVGAGQGMLLMGHTVAVQASVKGSDAAHAASMYTFLRTLGFCLGLLIGAVIVKNLLSQRVQHLGLLINVESGVESLVVELQHMDDGLVQLQLRGAFLWALRRLHIFMASLSGFNMILQCVGSPRLHGYLTGRT